MSQLDKLLFYTLRKQTILGLFITFFFFLQWQSMQVLYYKFWGYQKIWHMKYLWIKF
jgi:hypothetical protein